MSDSKSTYMSKQGVARYLKVLPHSVTRLMRKACIESFGHMGTERYPRVAVEALNERNPWILRIARMKASQGKLDL